MIDHQLPQGAALPPQDDTQLNVLGRSDSLETMVLHTMTGTAGFLIFLGLAILCCLTQQLLGYVFFLMFSFAGVFSMAMAFHNKDRIVDEFSPFERGRRGTEESSVASVPLTLPDNEVKIYFDNGDEAKVVSLREFKR